MNDWTGERFVLGAGGAQIHHEHLHRYSLASDLTDGNVVLDLGCGTGVGTAMLASRGASVTGVDIDAQTVASAAERYGPGIAFIEGSAYAIPLPDSSVDVVVCFEVIEHVEEPARVLSEIARVLRDEGLLLISTPMKAEYNKGLIKPNPFHLNEMEHEDFVALVGAVLPSIRVIRQRSMVVSAMWTDEVTEMHLMGDREALHDVSPVYEVLIATRADVLPKVGSSLYMEGIAQLEGEPETVRQVRVAQIQLAEWQALVDEVVEHRNNIQARVVYLEALLAEK